MLECITRAYENTFLLSVFFINAILYPRYAKSSTLTDNEWRNVQLLLYETYEGVMNKQMALTTFEDPSLADNQMNHRRLLDHF